MFATERLRPLAPTVFPVMVTEERTATRQALIDWRGNRYSVPPGLATTTVLVKQQLGYAIIGPTTRSGVVIARYRTAEPGLGVTSAHQARHRSRAGSDGIRSSWPPASAEATHPARRHRAGRGSCHPRSARRTSFDRDRSRHLRIGPPVNPGRTMDTRPGTARMTSPGSR